MYVLRLLAEFPNFEFEVRGPLQFKNVDQPMMCYFLTKNTEKDEYFEIDVPEEISYDFMPSKGGGTGTPPQTPYLFPTRSSSGSLPTLQSPVKRPTLFPFMPELKITDSTPIHTPIHTPETSPPSMGKSTATHRGGGGIPACPFSDNVKSTSRKTSIESAETTGTIESNSMTQSESDYSIMSNEDAPSFSLMGGNAEQSPHILVTKDENSDLEGLRIMPTESKSASSSTTTLMHPVKEEGIEKSKSDSDLLQKQHSLSENTNGVLSRSTRSPSCDRSDRSFSVTSEESFDEDNSTPTSPNHTGGSVRFVRPRTSSLRERVSAFESMTKNRRSGLSTTSYLQTNSPLGSFDEDAGK